MRPSFPPFRPTHLCLALAACVFSAGLGAQTIQTLAGGAPQPGKTYSSQISVAGAMAAAADGQGNVYVAASSSAPTFREILKVTPAGQMTIATGQPFPGTAGDGGPATQAQLELGTMTGMAVDAAGNLYFPESSTASCDVRKLTVATGIITTVAGTPGKCGYAGDGGAATSAQLKSPRAVALDSAGNLYIADTNNNRVREVAAATGVITTVMGNGNTGALAGEQVSGTVAQVAINGSGGVAVGSNGDIFSVDITNHVVWKLHAASGQVTLAAGLPPTGSGICASAADSSGDGCLATQAIFNHLSGGIAVDANGNGYIADGSAVREIVAGTGVVQLYAGSLTAKDNGANPNPGDGGPPLSALFFTVNGLSADANGNVYIADSGSNRVRKISGGTITTVAGNDLKAYSGDGGPALNAQVAPLGVALDGQGNLYVTGRADVRKVTAPGTSSSIISTIAGMGWASYSGDGGPAAAAHLFIPAGIVVDGSGDVIFADYDNSRIREIAASTGVITTIAGNGAFGYSGDSGPASAAVLDGPYLLTQDAAGDIFFADNGNNVIREITTDGKIHTVVGNGTAAYSGDGGLATAATLNSPQGVAVATNGDLYISDTGNFVVRKVSQATGIISTFAGNGTEGLTGMNGPATAAEIDSPNGMGLDGAGNLFVTDARQGVLLEVLASDGTIHLLSGNGTDEANQDGGLAINAAFCDPGGLVSDAHGNVYFADACGGVVREVKTQPASSLNTVSLSFGQQLVGAASAAQTVTLSNAGGVNMNVAAVKVTGAGYAESDTCTGASAAALAPGASCTINVIFTPTATGIQPGNITITDAAYDSPLTVTLAGTGIAPVVTLAPAALNFGTQQLLAAGATQTVTISNSGTAPLTITAVGISGPFAQTNNCGSTLAVGASCTARVSFVPVAVGPAAGALTLTDSAGNSPQSVTLGGTGAAAPQIALSLSSLTFASQGIGTTSNAQTVTVSNPGNATATITGITITGPFTESNGCGTSLAAGATCTVSVIFAPTATGAASGTLSVADNAAGSPQTVSLGGSGIGAGVSLAPSSLNFGGVTVGATSAPISLTITNTSVAVLTITSTGVSSGFALTGSCTTVQPGTSCSQGVTFSPAAAGAAAGTLTLQDNAAGGTQTVPLAGLGTAAGVAVTPGQLSFAALTVGQTSFAQTVTLANTGNAPLTAIAIPGAAGDFAVSNNQCGATLAGQASCTFQVAVTPSVTGADSATLTLSDSLGTQALALSATGLPLGLTQSNTSVNFGSQTVGFASGALTVGITNPGSSAIGITGVGSSSGLFTESNNCGASLAGGATCSVNVTFTPTAAGAATGMITITPASGSALSIAAAGQGVQGLALEPSNLSFGNQAVGGESQQQTVNILNTGVTAFTLSSFQTSGDYVVTQNLCTQAVAPGGVCEIFVAYAPSATGASSGSLTLTDTTGVLTATVALSGQGTRPGIAANPPTVAFGSAVVGQNSDIQTITVNNNGSAPLNIQALSTNGDFTVVGSNCLTATGGAQALAVGANCIINLTMQPSSLGTRTGALAIANDASGTLSVSLTGAGQGANLTAEPADLSFGSVPVPGSVAVLSAVPQVVTVTNHGSAALGVNSVSLQGGFTQSNTCGASLAAGASCTVSIGFSPRALGQWQGLLTVNTADGASHTVTTNGLGSPNGLVMSPSALSFGGVAVGQTSAPQIATLTNNSGQTISNLAISTSGEYNQTNNCGTSLAIGATCSISVTVTPVLSGIVTGNLGIFGQVGGVAGSVVREGEMTPEGLRAAAAVATSNVASIALRSSGNPASLAVSSPNLTFGSQAVATASAAQTVTVSNGGSTGVSGLTLTSTPDFPFTTTCTTALGASSNCTISVTFDPTAFGARSGTLTVNGSGGLQSTVALSGTATGSNLAVTPGSLAFGARAEGTTSAAQTLTLQNTGNASLTLSSATIAGTDFALSAGTCGTLPATLAANASCNLVVTFTPSTLSTENAVLSLASTAGNGTVAVGLSGSGSLAGFKLSATSLAFGNQGVGNASAAQTVTLNNLGTSAITITSIGASVGFSESNNCGGSVAGGSSCAVQVTFKPTAAGAQTATLMIADSGATQTVALSGTGTQFQLTSTGGTVNIDAGGTASFPLSLTPGQFTGAVTLNCSGAPANATCTINPASLNLTAGGAAAAATVTLATVSRGAVPPGEPGAPPASGPAPWVWLALAALLAWLAAAGRRKRRWLLGAAAGLAMAAAACGGNSNLPTNHNGTPAGDYTLVVTAASGTSSQTVTLTVTVN